MPLFYFFLLVLYSLKRILTIFSFSYQILGSNSRILEKEVFFCLVVRGVYPPYNLSGPTTKKITFLCVSSLNWFNTGEFTKRVLETSYQLFVTLCTLFIYPSAYKQLRRHLPNPFREFPRCVYGLNYPPKNIKILLKHHENKIYLILIH